MNTQYKCECIRISTSAVITGKSIMIPEFTIGDLATDSMYDDEMIRNIMERHYIMMKELRVGAFDKIEENKEDKN